MNAYAPCPRCNAVGAEKLKFTWWGGVLGPKLLTHVKCPACGKKYNGKTGRENTVNIIIYGLVAGVICFVLFFLLALAFVLLNPK